MSLTQCKTCTREISSDARICPHCGKKRYYGIGKLLWTVFLAIVLVNMVKCVAQSQAKSVSHESGLTIQK